MTAIRSHPTVYRGARFRSRLEAQWAAFFDLIRWSWVYEPFDTDDWIPDFLIQGNAPFLVEVGPCVSRNDYIAKAAKPLAYPDRPTLVVGVSPLVPLVGGGPPWTGMLVNEFGGSIAECWLASGPDLAIFSDDVHRPCLHSWGEHHHLDAGWESAIEQLWRRASNEVQWKGPERIGSIIARDLAR
jgi:hypothetical protein